MSNDIQPNQPVILSLHPDTQTIQQMGEKMYLQIMLII